MDKYDAEIEAFLGLDSGQLAMEWSAPAALFQYCTPNGFAGMTECGCLTMVRWNLSSRRRACDPTLTRQIQQDERIPPTPDIWSVWKKSNIDQRRAMLTAFAEWQRAMDATIRQGKPWHPEFSPAPTARVESVAQPAEVVAV